MAAAPFNPSDLGAMAGSTYRDVRKFPFTPGIEGSGTVVEAGTGFLPRLLKGRRVACSTISTGQGTYAEYMVTSANLCVPLARTVSMEQGAMLLVNPLTALAIFKIAQSGKHRAIVSTAAASALGGMILRLGKRFSIPIIHVVRRQEQVDLVRTRGGEFILNSGEDDFVEHLRVIAQELRATLMLDAIAGNMTQQLADAAPYGSTILLYSRLSRKNIEIDSHVWIVKNLHAHGWLLSNWLARKNIVQRLQLSRQAQSLLATDLGSPVRRRLPLSAAQQGVEAYIKDMTAGKILLVADPQEVALDDSPTLSLI
jgi:NADPH2:quinone reductase